MKLFQNFFFLVTCVSLLSGCISASQKATETERVDMLATSTITPPPTITSSLTPTLSLAAPTLEATPTPPPLPTLLPSRHILSYQLTKPTPEGLLELMDIINTQYGYFGNFHDDKGNLIFDSMLDELSNVLYVTATETNFYYPDDFPDSQLVWDYYPFSNQDHYPVFPSVYLESLTNAVLDDFNRHPDHLKDRGVLDGKGYAVQIYQVELDHDPQPEWLVRMDWEEIGALSWLVLDQNPDGSLTKLPQSLPDAEGLVLSGVTIEALQDFTGDGLTDIISVKQGYTAGTDWYLFYIATGTKKGFQELNSIDYAVSVTNSAVEPHYTIETPPGSNWLTLTTVDPHRINWDCGWDSRTTYRWPFGREQITITGKEIPQTPDCSFARAVSLLDPVDNATAIRLIENAISHLDPNDLGQRDKLLFAHYRLSILYAILDQDSLSRKHLEWLVENLTESEQYMKENLSLLLEEKKINAIKLCDSLYSAVAEIPSGWEKYMGATAAAHAYPGSSEIYPPAICPLRDIIMDQLLKVNLIRQPIPEKALADEMIQPALIQTYPILDQTHPASFMLIREKTPFIAGYVPTLDGWKWRILEEWDATEDPPQAFSRDITGDGLPELAYFQKYKYWSCPENEEGYKVFLTTSAGKGFVSITHYVCNPVNKTFDLAKHVPDENRDGVVDWVTDEISQYAGDSVLTAERVGLTTWFTPNEIISFFSEKSSADRTVDMINELTDKLYVGNNVPMVRQKLISARIALNGSDPLADWEWQRLTYLIGISYEMEGQAYSAIEAFTSVLQSKHQTLWGNLVELHLMTR